MASLLSIQGLHENRGVSPQLTERPRASRRFPDGGGHAGATARIGWAVLLASSLLTGCAAWTNPVSDGLPAHAAPVDLLAIPKDCQEPLRLTALQQPRPTEYRLAAGDVLGVYIEGVLGDVDVVPPVNVVDMTGQAPSLGFPVVIREDGTLSLPQIEPLSVDSMTVTEAEQAIIKAYTTGAAPILQPGRERIIVSLVRPRQVRVLVLRQDSPSGAIELPTPGIIRSSRQFRGGAEGIIRGNSNGTGTIVDLPAYENDVLNALARTGGLPGLDAANAIVIQRGASLGLGCTAPGVASDGVFFDGEYVHLLERGEFPVGGRPVVRIPLRIWPGQPLPFGPEDIILHAGDVVLIEARSKDLYYTGGLLPSGEFPLPRDHDLTVIEAITQVGGPLVNGGINSNNLSGALVAPGIGAPSPRLLTVVRRTPDGRQVPLVVDIDLALHDAKENILVQAGDVLILQESRPQALARYFSQFFNFRLSGVFLDRGSAAGTATVSGLP